MNRAERQSAVFLVLAAYVGGSVVAAAVLAPAGEVARTVVFPGVVYLEAVGALGRFADIASVGPAAMHALYAAAGYLGWCVAAYLAGVRALGLPRGELKAMALAFPGVLGAVAGVAMLVGGALGAAGVVGGLSTMGFLGVALAGAVLWLPSLAWLSRVRTARFGWQSRALEHVDAAVEVGAYAVLLAGLALAAGALAVGVGPQYLVVAALALVVVAVSVVVPTGGRREAGPGFG